ncbi:hypothetical protein ABW20_dc0102599 [Dactylellina cionopaga]|nr:hypothetical protein ABW20_dc0102599 [Dactylellina cionopaga]
MRFPTPRYLILFALCISKLPTIAQEPVGSFLVPQAFDGTDYTGTVIQYDTTIRWVIGTVVSLEWDTDWPVITLTLIQYNFGAENEEAGGQYLFKDEPSSGAFSWKVTPLNTGEEALRPLWFEITNRGPANTNETFRSKNFKVSNATDVNTKVKTTKKTTKVRVSTLKSTVYTPTSTPAQSSPATTSDLYGQNTSTEPAANGTVPEKSATKIGLGIGIGLGIPFVAITCGVIYVWCRNIKWRNVAPVPPVPPHSPHDPNITIGGIEIPVDGIEVFGHSTQTS